jgi:hypothetical protein
MIRWSAILGCVLLGCSEYGIEGVPLPQAPKDDTGDTDTDRETGDTDTGEITCPDRIWGAGSVSVDEDCYVTPPVGAFTPIVEWTLFSFDEYPNHRRTLMTPLVGQMTDDNGDGIRNDSDTPDILLVQFRSEREGVMRLISGTGTTVHWSVHEVQYGEETFHPYRYSGAAIGDIDADASPDIVTTLVDSNGTCIIGSFESDGRVKWVQTDAVVRCGGNAPALADMRGDGSPDIVFGPYILDGDSGAIRAEGEWGAGVDSGYVNSGYHAFPVDLDGDGLMEVVTGSGLYDVDGELKCITGFDDGYPAVADLDNDGVGEFVVTGGGTIAVFNSECWLIDSWAVESGGHGGPATIADYDGDGEPEIGVAERVAYTCYESDGTVLWTQLVEDYSSHSTGSSVFDFEGDGYAEVVYADESTVWIYQGATGAVRLAETSHTSATVNEYPVVVDVDGDGEVEIVIPDDEGVYVVGDADHTWVAGRQVWNQSAYHITNILDDLTLPTSPPPNWPTYNNFRSGDITPNEGAILADPFPLLIDICLDDCDEGVAQVVAQIGNQGLSVLPVGHPIQLVLDGEDGSRTVVDTQYSTFDVVSGMTSEGLVFRISSDRFEQEGTWALYVPDVGGEVDCNPENNWLALPADFVCPE